MFSKTCFGYPASMYLLLILFVSSSKSEAILLALCSSPVIAFFLYLKGTFEDQCPANFLALLKTWVSIPQSVWIILVLRNSFGLISNVSLMFSWYEFKSKKSLSVYFSSDISIIHVSFIEYWVYWYNYMLLHFAYINIWKNYRYRPTHRTVNNLIDKSVVNWKHTSLSKFP